MSYWDTSCLCKLYAQEADSDVFLSRAEQDTQPITSEIGGFEFWTTMRRKEMEGLLAVGAAKLLFSTYLEDVAAGLIEVIPMSPALQAEFTAIVEQCHSQSPPIPIRTLDGIHLAAARVAGQTEIITTDKRMAAAAAAIGMVVYSGHP